MNSKSSLMRILIVASFLSASIDAFGQIISPPYHKLPLTDFADITAGTYHTCAIKYNGNVYCWGLNDTEQSGKWDMDPKGDKCQGKSCVTKPELVATGSQVDAGMDHTCVLSSTGVASCWGNSSHGQLGIGVYGYSDAVPISGHVFSSISAGTNSTCGIAPDGLYCWGEIVNGNPTPVLIDSYNRYTSVTVGHLHACTLDAEGGLREVGCLGNNQLGQLGVDPAQFPNSSNLLLSSLGKAASRVTTQNDFTCADQPNGFVQCVGANGLGQLGSGVFTSGPTFHPQTVGSVPYVVGSEMYLSGVSTGTDHACALDPSGSAYCWGNGNWGQLGNGATGNFSRPQAVSGGLTFRKIAAGNLHTCGITTDNHIFCWGNNAYGQLGVGYVPDQNSSDPYRWTSTPIQATDPK